MLGYITLYKDEIGKELFNDYSSYKNSVLNNKDTEDENITFLTISNNIVQDVFNIKDNLIEEDEPNIKVIRKEIQAIRNLLKVTQNRSLKDTLRDRLCFLKEVRFTIESIEVIP